MFFVLDKGDTNADLTGRVGTICDRFATRGRSGVVSADPPRDRTAAAYSPAVGDWRNARAGIYEPLIAEELGADESGAFLVWGDPALYDSTLGILEEILDAARWPSSTTSYPASAASRRSSPGTASG